MKHSLLMVAVAAVAVAANAHVVWQIGQKDGTGNEFALAPDKYSDFLQHDFGWENNYFLIGRSDAKKSFPYVLPGINDKWAGSGSPAGRRTQQVNILFDIAKKGTGGAWTLVIDFADVHKAERPLLKVSVNGKARKLVLPVGGGDASIMKGDFSKARPFAAKFDLADGEIVEGANEIKITSIEGSWAIFDDVRLEGPSDAVLRHAHKGAYVRGVRAGDYLIPGTGKQPLLVDVEHLEGAPVVRVEIDGKVALEQRVEAGAYSLEAPMDAAVAGRPPYRANYRVFVDGACVREGTVVCTPQRDAGVAGYVDTRMGTAHSRWMLAPGPWTPFSMVKLSPDHEGTPAQKVGRGIAGNENLVVYLKHHYVPCDKARFFSDSMEYSFDDWTVGQFAKAIGDEAAYKVFSERGYWWKNVLNPETGFCHRRDSKGQWEKNLGPFAGRGYVEGNPWQLSFFVPQDVPALVEIVGRKRFLERLKWGFEKSCPFRYNAPGEHYAKFPVVQGNQQSMHFAFLFNWAKEPWETQKWARSIMERFYGFGDSTAWLGDEDQGQMSAWFVMASLGLFQTDGGCRAEPIYEIASPLFEEATINLGGRFGRGDTFTIKTHNASRANKYVQKAMFNGKPQNSFLLDAREVLKGGTLELWMGSEPNRKWGL